jgi:hypothetical protein
MLDCRAGLKKYEYCSALPVNYGPKALLFDLLFVKSLVNRFFGVIDQPSGIRKR